MTIKIDPYNQKRFIDISGQRFGRAVALSFEPGHKGHTAMWLCQCDCGVQFRATSGNLRSGITKSCGCLKRDHNVETWTKHGGSNTKLYGVWYAIKMRCLNPNNKRFMDYGGRGISVYRGWVKDFGAFRDYVIGELGERPSPAHSLDRIDNDGNYEPGNLRWATSLIQNNNKRRSKDHDHIPL